MDKGVPKLELKTHSLNASKTRMWPKLSMKKHTLDVGNFGELKELVNCS